MKTFIKACFIGIVTFSLVIVAATQSAHALATLHLSDGTTFFDVGDGCTASTCGGYVDSNPATGAVTYIGPVGAFTINVSTGITNPTLGTPALPEMHLNDVSMNLAGNGSLTIRFSETGYTSPAEAIVQTHVGGTTSSSGNMQFASYIDNSNTLFGSETRVGYLSFTGVPSFNGDTSLAVSTSNPYSIMTEAVITHNDPGKTTSFDIHVNVLPDPNNLSVIPEPISSTLFLVGAATLGFRRFRKNRKN